MGSISFGLKDALADLQAPLIELDRPQTVRFPFGGSAGISRFALDCDMIFSLPKVKVHHMAGVTAAVKNLFGCITGLRKAMSHVRYGEWGACFENLLLEPLEVLPPVVSLLDGGTAMHENGPNNGKPYQLDLLAASRSTIALDAAIYHLLGMHPDRAPLWSEALKREMPGSRIEDLYFPFQAPDDFDSSGFIFPDVIKSLIFLPGGRVRRGMKRVWDKMLKRA